MAPLRVVEGFDVIEDGKLGFAIDAVVFTSGTQAESWVKIFGSSTPPVVVTIGPQTTRNTEVAGLKVTLSAADHSLPGVIEALEECFRR